jgi:hypothetical protein
MARDSELFSQKMKLIEQNLNAKSLLGRYQALGILAQHLDTHLPVSLL